MLNANIVETLNVDVSILQINIDPAELFADQFEHHRENQTQLDKMVAVVSTCLIHKSFGTTVRGLMRAAEVRRDLERLNRDADLVYLDEIVRCFVSEMFAFKRLDLNGKEIESNVAEVENLFSEVGRILSERTSQEDSGRLLKDLPALQARFIEVVLAMVRDRAADVPTTGPGSSQREFERRLQELESQNFVDLVKDYALVASERAANKAPLPDIAYKQQREIEEFIRMELRSDIATFVEQKAGQFPKKRFRYFGMRRKDLNAGYVVEMEVLLSVRESISHLQRLAILRSALDKLDMFYAVLESISFAIRAAQSRTAAEAAKREESLANDEAATIRMRGDLISETIGAAFEATAKLMSDHAEREKGHERANVSLATNLKDLIEIFNLRNRHTTECLVALSALANHLRVHHMPLMNEVGEPSSPQTAAMVSMVNATLEQLAASQDRYTKASQKGITASSVATIAQPINIR